MVPPVEMEERKRCVAKICTARVDAGGIQQRRNWSQATGAKRAGRGRRELLVVLCLEKRASKTTGMHQYFGRAERATDVLACVFVLRQWTAAFRAWIRKKERRKAGRMGSYSAQMTSQKKGSRGGEDRPVPSHNSCPMAPRARRTADARRCKSERKTCCRGPLLELREAYRRITQRGSRVESRCGLRRNSCLVDR